MNKETINSKQAICIVIIFIMGSTLLLGTSEEAKNDAWIAIIIAIITALPMVLIYARILSLFKGMDIYDIVQVVFGKIIGKIIVLLYTWYAFHLGSMILRNFGEFINTVAMPETPMFVTMFILGLLCIMVVHGGVEVLGRSAKFFLPVILVTNFIVYLLAIPKFHFNYIKPILYNGFTPVIKGAFSTFSYPFAETVLFTTVIFALQPKKSAYKVYIYGLLIGGAIVLLINIRNIMMLSANILEIFYFPSYEAISNIKIGDFIQRIEGTVSIVFVISAFIKASVCLYAACKGVTKIFGLNNYTTIVVQIGLLMIYFSSILYDNIMEMEYWAFKVYAYYAFPFQVILPIIILIVAEIRMRKGNLKSKVKTAISQ
jgi:spore germination protein KB